MKKGVMEMCILHYLSQKDYYGYDIMRLMSSHFHDVSASTFYAILRRLKKEKVLDSYVGEISGGPQRKYYKITEAGRFILQTEVANWRDLSHAVEIILETKIY